MKNKISDEYLLLAPLGKGGFAKVFKARNLKYDYLCAVRVLDAYVTDEESDVYQKFLRECKIQLKLGSGCPANIVRTYLPRCKDGQAFAEMDLIDGTDLRKLIEKYNKNVPIGEIIRMAHDIGSALSYCHHEVYKVRFDKERDNIEDADDGSARISTEKEQELIEKYRVLHNDIHTGNIMRRNNDGTYMLLDFGLAVDGKDDIPGSSRRQQGAIEFLSAQRLEGKDPTPQDDIYGFGCVLYAMLTGLPPFPQKRNDENKKNSDIPLSEQSRILEAHRHTPPKPIERADVPQWIKDMTMRCLAKDPSERYTDGYELYNNILSHTEKKEDDHAAVDINILEKLNVQIKDLEKRNNSLSQNLQDFHTQYEKEKQTSENLEQMLSDKTVQVEKMQDSILELKGRNKQLRKRKNLFSVVSLIFGIAVGAALLASGFIHTKHIVPDDNSVLSENVNIAIDKLKAENYAKQKVIDSVVNENVILKQSGNADSEQYASLLLENAKITKEKKELEKQLFELKKEVKKLQTTNSTQSEQKQTIINLQNKISQLESTVSSLEKKNRDLSSANTRLEQEQRTTAQLKKRVADLEKQNKILTSKNNELNTKVANLKKENKALIENM